jgi:hypothetical protein
VGTDFMPISPQYRAGFSQVRAATETGR